MITSISEYPAIHHRYIFVYNFNFNISTTNGKGITIKNIGASEFTKIESYIIGKWKIKPRDRKVNR